MVIGSELVGNGVQIFDMTKVSAFAQRLQTLPADLFR